MEQPAFSINWFGVAVVFLPIYCAAFLLGFGAVTLLRRRRLISREVIRLAIGAIPLAVLVMLAVAFSMTRGGD
jgi:hypothetical protein